MYIKEKEVRLRAFMAGDIDLMTNVPLTLYDRLREGGAVLMSQPGLEVTFLGLGGRVFSDGALARRIVSSIDVDALQSQFGEVLKIAEQFVSNGVAGFIPGFTRVSEVAEVRVESSEVQEGEESRVTNLVLHFETGTAQIASSIKKMIEKSGVVVTLSPEPPNIFLSTLKGGNADLYLLGWKSEFGDAIDFYKSIVHSKSGSLGEFNAGGYSNAKVDSLIRKSDLTFDPQARFAILQQVMRILLEEDVFGVPLLETKILYAVKENTPFIPRIDGYINVAEFTVKK